MKLLALDTATDACSVALNINSELIEHYELMPRRHSHNLLPMIEKLLSEAGVTLNNIDALAFGRGPGTFTGLRVAASITQGLAFAVDIPVIPISTLAALAQQAHRCYASTHVISAIDARMGELYWGAFTEKNNLMVSQQNEVVIAPKKAILVHSEHTQWTGIGTGWLYHQQLSVSVNQFYEKALPHAQDIAALAEYDFNHGYLLPAEEAIPVYLRDKVALKKNER